MADTTAWTVQVSDAAPSPAASLSLSRNGAAPAPFQLNGVCYSPCPINASNADAPNIGDWFWDSFSGPGFSVTGWEALWQRDLRNLRALGANTIRVYCMLSRQLGDRGTYPDPWDSGQLFTHDAFLDQCWNGGTDPLYVLVGIPLPRTVFWLGDYRAMAENVKSFWTNILSETVAQVAQHPAVLGFVIQNEFDSDVVTYGPNTENVDFWWGQVEHFAALVKTALGGAKKLVGMAVHDDPNICGKEGKAHMAKVPSLDFWGVNAYQTQSFDSVFGPVPGIGPGYGGLSGAALKPVILTEWGIPATSRRDPADRATIYDDAKTIDAAAKIIATAAPLAYRQALCLGLYYFEYCDEWWSQPKAPNIWTWYGGDPAPGFPNGYWDQDGFGLYSIARGAIDGVQQANNASTWNPFDNMPAPIDIHTPRTAAIEALKAAFSTKR